MLLMSFAAAKEERGSSVTWLTKLLSLMGGCLGCWESTVHPNGDGNGVQGLMEDFWSTSNYDLDNNGLLSQRSMSFLILPNLNDSEFVNHGLFQWNQSRLQWVGPKRSEDREKNRNPTISWNATYDSLLGSNKRFTRRIALSEMVEFLEDVWEEEGLYE